jgi:hypothetical protein
MTSEPLRPEDDEEQLLSDTEAELTDMAKSQNGGDEGSLSDTEAETTELQEGEENG